MPLHFPVGRPEVIPGIYLLHQQSLQPLRGIAAAGVGHRARKEGLEHRQAVERHLQRRRGARL
jgi:hypothetical protein